MECVLAWSDSNPSMQNRDHLERVMRNTTGRDPALVIRTLARDMVAASIAVCATFVASKIASQVEAHTEAGFVSSSLSSNIFPVASIFVYHLASPIFGLSDDGVYKCRAVFAEVVRASAGLLTELPIPIQEAVFRLDNEVKASLETLSQQRSPDYGPRTVEAIYEFLLIRQAFWLGQPRRFINYFESHDRIGLQQFLDPTRENRPAKMTAILTEVAYSIIASSIRGRFDNTRPQFWFYGEGGTGKNYSVMELAKKFRASIITISFEKLGDDDLTGQVYNYAIKRIPGERSTLKAKGKLRDAVRDCGYRNPILLIDEFSAADLKKYPWKQSACKLLFNPEPQAAGDSDGLEDLAHVILFVMTNDGRKDFPRELRDRFMEYDIPPVDDPTLVRIRDNQIKQTANLVLQGAADARSATVVAKADPVIDNQNRQTTAEVSEVAADAQSALMRAAVASAEEFTNSKASLMLEMNSDQGARTIKKLSRAVFDYALVHKLLAGNADQTVDDEAIRTLIERTCAPKDTVSPPLRQPADDDSEDEKNA